mmetsp:Transcript_18495/g.60544  ORF Transcript_18495/g.60544 Transcript_18495/m.60544 type:complete len:105 (-) Transcript_18495:228-542(-)
MHRRVAIGVAAVFIMRSPGFLCSHPTESASGLGFVDRLEPLLAVSFIALPLVFAPTPSYVQYQLACMVHGLISPSLLVLDLTCVHACCLSSCALAHSHRSRLAS